MADALTVFPLAAADSDRDLRRWLTANGLEIPIGGTVGRGPTLAELGAILTELAYPNDPTDDGFRERQYEDGSWPPFSTLWFKAVPEDECAEALSFRLGPLEGPYEILNRVAKLCGAHVAISHSHTRPVLIDAGTTWEEFSGNLYASNGNAT